MVLDGVEFVGGEAVLGADGLGDRFGEDGPVVVPVGGFVEGASKGDTEKALEGEQGNVGEVADGVQAVEGQGFGGGRFSELAIATRGLWVNRWQLGLRRAKTQPCAMPAATPN
ncbi:hypothetical protein [Streptomyces sp. NBC_01244]|uniref:hypothetical protein n=1 Tax=Streptomyces sp. NBC_01244 TaxID=2903797 RepID=UPI002E15B87D|nr:hypothetical protein OG247_00070 [Streptomyces sp. NBC_01244]